MCDVSGKDKLINVSLHMMVRLL